MKSVSVYLKRVWILLISSIATLTGPSYSLVVLVKLCILKSIIHNGEWSSRAFVLMFQLTRASGNKES